MLPLFPRAPDAVIIVTGPSSSSDCHHLRRTSRRWSSCQTLDDLLVALVLGDEAALELAVDVGDLVVGRLRGSAGLSFGIVDVEQADRHPAAGRELEADALDAVDEVGGLVRAEQPVAARRRAP